MTSDEDIRKLASEGGMDPCNICGKDDISRCHICHSVTYCSRECQRIDWPIHELLCSSFATFRTNCPGPLFRRAIFFPVDEKSPKLIWVEVKVGRWEGSHENWEEEWELPQLDAYGLSYGPLGGEGDRMYLEENILLNRQLDNAIEICHRPQYLSDGSLPNESIIAATEGAHSWSWKGPFVVLQKKGLAPYNVSYRDITLCVLRDAVDFFITYNGKKSTMVAARIADRLSDQLNCFKDLNIENAPKDCGPKQPTGLEKVKAVKVSCKGDENPSTGMRAAKYISVELPHTHPIFSENNKPTEISNLIDFPILILKCPPTEPWWTESQYDNQAVTFLQLDVDSKSELFGWAPLKWQKRVGTVFAARADRKPLFRHRMKALCEFCEVNIGPLFKTTEEILETTTNEVIGRMTKANFNSFLRSIGCQKKRIGPVAGTPSPYT